MTVNTFTYRNDKYSIHDLENFIDLSIVKRGLLEIIMSTMEEEDEDILRRDIIEKAKELLETLNLDLCS